MECPICNSGIIIKKFDDKFYYCQNCDFYFINKEKAPKNQKIYIPTNILTGIKLEF
jgi:ribosomal protein L37AE/L43A